MYLSFTWKQSYDNIFGFFSIVTIATIYILNKLLTGTGVEFDFYETIVSYGVHFQHRNVHGMCLYVIQRKLIPTLTDVCFPGVTNASG